MAINIDPPRPGDVISSDLMRQMLEELADLGERLATLEALVPGARGELVITDISPAIVAMGGEIHIRGANFGISKGGTVVTFDGGNLVSSFKFGSDDSLLVLDVPAFSLPGGGGDVTVAVSSAVGGFDHRDIVITQPTPTIAVGTLDVVHVSWPSIANNVIPLTGGDFVFPFRAELRSSTMADTFDLDVTLPSGWTWQLTADADGVVPRGSAIFLPKQAGTGAHHVEALFIRVGVPASAGTTPFDVTMTVSLRARTNPTGFMGTSGPVTVPVGAPLPGLGTIHFALPPAVLGPRSAVDGGDVFFEAPTPANRAGRATLRARNLSVGRYNVAISWEGGVQNGWTATLGADASAPPQAQTTFDMTAAGDTDVVVLFRANGAASEATLVVQVTSASAPDTDFGSVRLGVLPAP